MEEMVPGSAHVLPPDADEDEASAAGSGGNSLRVRKQSVAQPKPPVSLDCLPMSIVYSLSLNTEPNPSLPNFT